MPILKQLFMPELPEIALYKKYVDSTSLYKKIVKVAFPDKSLLQAPERDFKKALVEKEFQESKRLGKYLFLKLDKKCWLVFHFGMTGNLEYFKNRENPKFTKMLMEFENGYKLAFTCPRKLGKIFLARDVAEFKTEHFLGKDALSLSWSDFEALSQNKKGAVKGFITNQEKIAGIGNMYADEILFQAGIHPKSKVSGLSENEKKKIFNQISKVLKTVIKNDGQRSQLPENYLTPHRKEGENCPACSGEIKKIKVSGRSTYYCPSCQKEIS